MLKNWDTEPEIIPCLILIQEAHTGQMDAYLLQSAVRKYYLGVGKHIKKFLIMNGRIKEPTNLNYNLIQIDGYQGIMAYKCPTISGGQWVGKFIDFSFCEKNIPIAQGQKLHIIHM